MDVLEHIQKEWNTLKSAPGSFCILVMLAFIAAWSGLDWLHADRFASSKQEVDTVKQQNELLSLRIQGKDDQLNDYRSCVLIPPTSTPTGIKKTENKRQEFDRSTTRFSNAKNKDLEIIL